MEVFAVQIDSGPPPGSSSSSTGDRVVLTPRVGAPLISTIPSRCGKEEAPLPRWTEDGHFRRVVYHGTTAEALCHIFALDSEGNFVGLKESNPVSYTHLTLPTNREV